MRERKLTDPQCCWRNGNGLKEEELEGFHALVVHVDSMPIINKIKICRRKKGVSLSESKLECNHR